MSRMKNARRRELEILLKIMPEAETLGLSLSRPNSSEYRYCRMCRLYFKNNVSLVRCPVCRYPLRGPRGRRRLKNRIDPEMYGVR